MNKKTLTYSLIGLLSIATPCFAKSVLVKVPHNELMRLLTKTPSNGTVMTVRFAQGNYTTSGVIFRVKTDQVPDDPDCPGPTGSNYPAPLGYQQSVNLGSPTTYYLNADGLKTILDYVEGPDAQCLGVLSASGVTATQSALFTCTATDNCTVTRVGNLNLQAPS